MVMDVPHKPREQNLGDVTQRHAAGVSGHISSVYSKAMGQLHARDTNPARVEKRSHVDSAGSQFQAKKAKSTVSVA